MAESDEQRASYDGRPERSPPHHRPPPLTLHSSAPPYQHAPAYSFHASTSTSYSVYPHGPAQACHPVGPAIWRTFFHPHPQPHLPHFVLAPHSAPVPGHPAPPITPSLISMPSTTSISSLASVSSSPAPVSAAVTLDPSDQQLESGRTNWEPIVNAREAGHEHLAMVSPGRMTHPGKAQNPPMLSRSRRAAASKARSNIASIVDNLRSPPLSARSVDRFPPLPARPPSANPSRRSGISTASPAMSELSLKLSRPRTALASSSGSLRVPIQYQANQPTIMLEVKNHRGVLLETPPGAKLEVNDLLILHPPALSPNAKLKPVNQYNQPPGLVSDGLPIEGYRSMFEMYTCRVCSKTYDGRNARSVARRHLQDKHGVKLALQKRRTRWDLEPDRPKTAVDAREKTLKSKRDWATRTRQAISCLRMPQLTCRHIQRLEKAHAKFLERYGPNGIRTPCNTHLTAPSMRAPVTAAVRNKTYPDGRLEWNRIPKALRDSLAKLVGIEAPVVVVEYEDADGEDCEQEQEAIGGVERPTSVLDQAELVATSLPRPKRGKRSKAAPPGGVQRNRDVPHISPIRSAAPRNPSLQRTPISNSRLTNQDEGDEDEAGLSQPNAWDNATYASYHTLQHVLAQYNEDETTDESQHEVLLSNPAVISSGPFPAANQSSSPDPLQALQETPQTGWVSPEEAINAALANPMWFARAQTYDYSSSSTGDVEKAWPVGPTPEIARMATPSNNSVGGDVVAAESLLNLHSTPARPEDEGSQTSTSSSGDLVPARSSTPYNSAQAASSVIRGLLDAPDITPRPRPIRARSFIQPFNKSRPDALTRALSFSQQILDDPFAISPNTTALLKAADESLNGKRRRDVVGASPSPLTKRKKDEHRFAGFDRFESPRRPMNSLRPNLHSVTSGPASATKGMSAADSRMTPVGMSTAGLGFAGYASMSSSGASTELRTPVRGRAAHVPSSLNKMWQFSSPSDPGAAASLGLVPSWGSMLGGGTPGMSGMVASETPVRPLRQ